jgi:hemoglobin/transferrin/lactoferrin receptor protein
MMIKRFKLFVFLPLLVCSTLMGQDVSLSGQVNDAGTGRGLAYVDVLLRSRELPNGALSALTDNNGHFVFTRIKPGSYQLQVNLLGYYPQNKSVEVTEAQAATILFELKPAMIPLGEVRVSTLRYDKLERSVSMPVAVVPREYFPRQSSMTLSDVLSREPGIALARDGGWGTSINIRGMGESRLVSMVDGARIETASDLNAALSMFDINEIERIEVIKGAASSLYGTGALGGVVNILTKKGQYYDNPTIHGQASGIFEGVNSMFGSHVGIESGAKAWKLRLSGGYRTAGDYKTPEGSMENSGFTDRNVNATLGIKPVKNQELEINAQHYQAFDAGIPGGAPFGPTAKATYKEVRRQLISGKYTFRNLLPGLEDLSIRAYHQYIDRDVEMIPNTPPSIIGSTRMTALKVLPRGLHNTTGLVVDSRWKTGENHILVAGVDFWHRKMVTTRDKYIRQEILDAFQMVTQTSDIIRGEKPNPDARFGSAGLFVQQESKLFEDKLELTYGARLDRIRVANEEQVDPLSLTINGVVKDPVPNQRVVYFADTVGAWSWSANVSALWHLLPSLDLTFNTGRSFRSPSLEERFKYIDLGSKVRLGDPSLKPEKGLFGDLGVRIWLDRLQFQANGYVHYLDDMIVEVPGSFVYTLATGPDAGLTDTLPALVNANVERALLAGFEASINTQPFNDIVLFAKSSFVRGFNLTTKGDLPLIPPFSSGVGFRYQLPGVFSLEWVTSFYSAQNRIADGETATEHYFLSDFAVYSAPRELGITSFQLFAGVDNVFNASYRNHLATNRGLVRAEPGRNIFIRLVMRF